MDGGCLMEDGWRWRIDSDGWWLEGLVIRGLPWHSPLQAAIYAANGCSEVYLIVVSRCYMD